MGWVIAACGIFSICGAVFNWDWFMNNSRARFFVRLFGRNGARLFYGILGAMLFVVGILIALEILQ